MNVRIEHVALWTEDLERMKEFYTRFFGGKPGKKYANRKTGFESYFIAFDSGARLEIMRNPSVTGTPGGQRRGYAHIAFSVGSREEVDALTERLKEGGCPVVSGPRETGDGYYESCILDPDGNPVEITT